MLKKFIKKTIGLNRLLYVYNLKNLISNFYTDFHLFYQHSNVFKVDNFDKEEAQIILDYHSIEKGMLFSDMKCGFSKQQIIRLNKKLRLEYIVKNINCSQILVAYQIMCKYYELHLEKGFDISTYYSEENYNFYKSLLKDYYSKDFKGVIDFSFNNFYENISSSFETFVYTRKSIRDFTGEKIEKEILNKAVILSLTSPSVCNRQASKVYLVEEKYKIDEILNIQGGFRGFSENVNQLLILTNDRSYYYSVGERNQFYIDGGIFLMNLLYSLHYYKIANCPANWGKLVREEKRMEKIIEIPKSEKIICIIPIGIAKEKFSVTLSKRRDLNEVFVSV